MTIRDAAGDDLGALERLAQLDSSPLPELPIMLAEAGGEVRAAYSLSEGRAIADPFHRTAELVELLELRAGQAGTNGRVIANPREQLRSQVVTRAARA
ncbi:MAG: hypothetical protein ACRDL1_06460 [Solirubrobacterales bacterium]